MLVMGLDPGLAITGYGLVEKVSPDADSAAYALHGQQDLTLVEYGVVTTPAKQLLPERLLAIDAELGALIAKYQPDVVAVEEMFFGRNVTTALIVGQARGVALLCAARAGLPIHEYKPNAVKQAITGYGRASKTQMQEMVRMLLNLDHVPQPDDAADAVAVAICHVYSARLDELVRRVSRPMSPTAHECGAMDSEWDAEGTRGAT
jgi:crossover junction endodeoxyribonuclease RuvC